MSPERRETKRMRIIMTDTTEASQGVLLKESTA